jgi:hypothetical protein
VYEIHSGAIICDECRRTVILAGHSAVMVGVFFVLWVIFSSQPPTFALLDRAIIPSVLVNYVVRKEGGVCYYQSDWKFAISRAS